MNKRTKSKTKWARETYFIRSARSSPSGCLAASAARTEKWGARNPVRRHVLAKLRGTEAGSFAYVKVVAVTACEGISMTEGVTDEKAATNRPPRLFECREDNLKVADPKVARKVTRKVREKYT